MAYQQFVFTCSIMYHTLLQDIASYCSNAQDQKCNFLKSSNPEYGTAGILIEGMSFVYAAVTLAWNCKC